MKRALVIAVLFLSGCVCIVELEVPPHMDCKTIGQR
jgi:hypothetical protein